MPSAAPVAPPELSFEPESHRYYVQGVEIPGVTRIIDALFPHSGAQFYTDVARERGTAVHRACEYFLEGDLDESSLDERIAGHVEALRRFLRESGFVATHTEERVISSRYRFAGTLDLVGPLNGRNALIDFKTGEPLPQHALQTAAYQIAFEEMGLGRIEDRFGLYLRGDGRYRLKKFENVMDRQMFLSGAAVFQWRNQHGQ